jgi:hypothetical protein
MIASGFPHLRYFQIAIPRFSINTHGSLNSLKHLISLEITFAEKHPDLLRSIWESTTETGANMLPWESVETFGSLKLKDSIIDYTIFDLTPFR